jgi:hypothetical protein
VAAKRIYARGLAKRIYAKVDTRTPLHAWLSRNHPQISAALRLAGDGRGPCWVALVAVAAEAGILARSGSPIHPHTMRAAWLALEKKRDIRSGKVPPPRRRGKAAVPPLVRPVGDFSPPPEPERSRPPPMAQTPLASEIVERPRTKFVSRPAVLRSRLPPSERDKN